MEIGIRVDTATPAVGALEEGLKPENLLPYLAETGTIEVKNNLMSMDANRPNKLGGERTHYYQSAAEGTEWHMDGESAVISIHAPGIVTRYFGGTIQAGAGTIHCGPNAGQPTKYLTIPVTAEAYGHRACDIPDLQILWGRNGPYAIGRKATRSAAVQGEGGSSTQSNEVLFVLKKEVEVDPDPTLLPSSLRMTASLKSSFNDYVALLKERAVQYGEESQARRMARSMVNVLRGKGQS